MCLEKITGSFHKPKRGYKVGKKTPDGFDYVCNPTEFDRWVGFKGNTGLGIGMSGGKNDYPLGFHIIKTLKDARKVLKVIGSQEYKIFPCEYIGVMAEGTESDNLCCNSPIGVVVAACIRISPISIE